MTIAAKLFQGKVENNMPAFGLLPPTSLAVEQPEMMAALLANADGLTSHLDLYVTLRELLAMGSKDSLEEQDRGGTSSHRLIILTQVCRGNLCFIRLRGESVQRLVSRLRSFLVVGFLSASPVLF